MPVVQPTPLGGGPIPASVGTEVAAWPKRLRTFLEGDAPDSPRTRLAVVTWLWLDAPQRLAGACAAKQIERLARALYTPAARPAAGIPQSPALRRPQRAEATLPTGGTARMTVAATADRHAGMAQRRPTGSDAPAGRDRANMQGGGSVHGTARQTGERPQQRLPLATAMSDVTSERAKIDQPAPGPAAEVRMVTLQGGWFLLFNALQLPALQALVRDAPPAPCPAAGWYWLYRLGRALGGVADPPLLHFLAGMAGLAAEQGLEALPPLPGEADLARLTRQRYGEAVCNPALFPIPALVLATPSHLDVHYRMADLRLDVRRVALDVNPGWLPWLGRVVNFHYGQLAELACLQS